jgi:hypothetical protein
MELDKSGQISVAINQEMCPAEVRCQPEGAVEPLGVFSVFRLNMAARDVSQQSNSRFLLSRAIWKIYLENDTSKCSAR